MPTKYTKRRRGTTSEAHNLLQVSTTEEIISVMLLNRHLLYSLGHTVNGQIKDFRGLNIVLHKNTMSRYLSGDFVSPSTTFYRYLAFYWGLRTWELLMLGERVRDEGIECIDVSLFSLPDLPLKFELLKRGGIVT